jgi:exosortase K
LLFLLYPTDWLTGLLMGSTGIYSPENGFFHERLNIMIDKSCAGFNYWVLSFLLFTYLEVNHLKNNKEKALALLFALLGAYFFTIFVNASRIVVTIIVQPKT